MPGFSGTVLSCENFIECDTEKIISPNKAQGMEMGVKWRANILLRLEKVYGILVYKCLHSYELHLGILYHL